MKTIHLFLVALLFQATYTELTAQRTERGDQIEIAALQLKERALEAAKAGTVTEAYKISEQGLLIPNEGYTLIMNMGDENVFCLPISGRGELERIIRMPERDEIENGGIARCICEERGSCEIQRMPFRDQVRVYCRGACNCQIAIQYELKLFSRFQDLNGRWVAIR